MARILTWPAVVKGVEAVVMVNEDRSLAFRDQSLDSVPAEIDIYRTDNDQVHTVVLRFIDEKTGNLPPWPRVRAKTIKERWDPTE